MFFFALAKKLLAMQMHNCCAKKYATAELLEAKPFLFLKRGAKKEDDEPKKRKASCQSTSSSAKNKGKKEKVNAISRKTSRCY